MIKTINLNENIGGVAFNILHFAAQQPTKNYIICFPGMGEVHATDTTRITNFDWYPKYANNGTLEAEFNIIAVQPTGTTHLFNAAGLGVINHCILKYGIQNLVVVGYDGGGTPTYSSLYRDTAGVLRGIVVFGGTPASNSQAYQIANNANLNTAKDVPAYIYHHTSDPIVSLATVTNYVNAVNSGATRNYPMSVSTVTSSSHNEWVGKMTATKTLPAYQFIMSRFAPDTDCISCKEEGKQEIIALLKQFIASIE